MEVLQEAAIPEQISQLLEQAEEAHYTVFHCRFVTNPKYKSGWWVNINRTTYLICGNEQIELLHAINVPLAPERHYLQNFGESLRFILIFPQVPKHWNRFDFVEQCPSGGGFKETDIKRIASGIYKITL